MIDPTAKLSVSRQATVLQATVLGISRGSDYYQPRPVSDADVKLMHRIDKLHMAFPFAGSRMLQGLLAQDGFKVGRVHGRTGSRTGGLTVGRVHGRAAACRHADEAQGDRGTLP